MAPHEKKEKTYSLPSRSITTAADLQRHALAKLLADPDKPVHIPAPPPDGVRKLRDPRETMKNVQGSSAGAGSGASSPLVLKDEHGADSFA